MHYEKRFTSLFSKRMLQLNKNININFISFTNEKRELYPFNRFQVAILEKFVYLIVQLTAINHECSGIGFLASKIHVFVGYLIF